MQWNPIDLLLHLNDHLDQLALQIGGWSYLLLFLIIFCESGLVITPFLPGDALLFTVGALTATTKHFELYLVLILLPIAAFLGYTLNYWIGAAFGRKLFKRDDSRVFNRKYLNQTHAFYERHGGKTIALARYLPVIRTFAPFVAGMAAMHYRKFFLYNLLGGIFWVFSVVLIGHFFALQSAWGHILGFQRRLDRPFFWRTSLRPTQLLVSDLRSYCHFHDSAWN